MRHQRISIHVHLQVFIIGLSKNIVRVRLSNRIFKSKSSIDQGLPVESDPILSGYFGCQPTFFFILLYENIITIDYGTYSLCYGMKNEIVLESKRTMARSAISVQKTIQFLHNLIEGRDNILKYKFIYIDILTATLNSNIISTQCYLFIIFCDISIT